MEDQIIKPMPSESKFRPNPVKQSPVGSIAGVLSILMGLLDMLMPASASRSMIEHREAVCSA